jgi:hypothetical protein
MAGSYGQADTGLLADWWATGVLRWLLVQTPSSGAPICHQPLERAEPAILARDARRRANHDARLSRDRDVSSTNSRIAATIAPLS